MPVAIVLIKGENVSEEVLRTVSLMNAKQLVLGDAPEFGVVLHVRADTMVDLGNALKEFAEAPDVEEVITIALQK